MHISKFILLIVLMKGCFACELVSTAESLHLTCKIAIPKYSAYTKKGPERTVIALPKDVNVKVIDHLDTKTKLKKINNRFYIINLDPERKFKYHAQRHLILYKQEKKRRCHWSKSLHKPFTIVIDPGHGGDDYGSTKGSLKEKNITLNFSKILVKSLMHESLPMNAILTRINDADISLAKRTQIASQNHADLFISLHADTVENKNDRGVAIFTLSEGNASSAFARNLAEYENQIQPIKQKMSLDFEKNMTHQQSREFSQSILEGLRESVSLHSGQIESADFIVLKTMNIPSCLIEIGFISNEQDRSLLQNDAYIHFLAATFSDIIKRYFEENKYQFNYVCNQAAKPLYIYPSKGTTLKDIASKYELSIAQLKSINLLGQSNLITDKKLFLQ